MGGKAAFRDAEHVWTRNMLKIGRRVNELWSPSRIRENRPVEICEMLVRSGP